MTVELLPRNFLGCRETPFPRLIFFHCNHNEPRTAFIKLLVDMWRGFTKVIEPLSKFRSTLEAIPSLESLSNRLRLQL
jgi:hypothetical protein